jgi:hypothetical protein
MNTNGDSLWTQIHYWNNNPTYGVRFQQCRDHGFVVIGQINMLTSTYGHILKTDSLGRVLPPACLSVSGPVTICQGDSVELSAVQGYQYLWSTSDTTQSIWVTQPGDYVVTISDSTLSAVSDTISVSLFNSQTPVITVLNNDLYASGTGTFQWYLNDTLIAGADSSVITPSANGLYTVELTDSNNCTVISTPFNFTTIDISEIAGQVQLKEDMNNISVWSPETINNVRILDMSGKVILSRNVKGHSTVIDKTGFAKGIYIINLSLHSGKGINKPFVVN